MNIRLLMAQVLLLLLGTLAVGTATPELLPDQTWKALAALLITLVAGRLRPSFFLRIATPAWIISLVLLLAVLVVGVGTEASPGTHRWLPIPGFRFQPSEFAKLTLTLMLASFFARRGVHRKLISATGMLVLTTGLIILEPDMGTTILTFSLGIVLMYAAGVRFGNIGALLLASLLCAAPIASFYLERHPYILERIHMHQGQTASADVGLDQIGKAHRDLAYGGLWGQGPDAPRYPYFADHTDLAIASVGFSTGLLGVTMALFAYWLVASSALQVARKASLVHPLTRELHGAVIMSTGAMYMIVGQACINLLVAAGRLPVTGVPLPLISYGFSSMLTMSLALALIHSALREVGRALPEGGERHHPPGQWAEYISSQDDGEPEEDDAEEDAADEAQDAFEDATPNGRFQKAGQASAEPAYAGLTPREPAYTAPTHTKPNYVQLSAKPAAVRPPSKNSRRP